MPKQLILLDASALGEAGCILRIFNNVIMGYSARYNNNDIEFGSAFHKFRKHFRDKGMAGVPEGLADAVNYYKSKTCFIRKPYLTLEFLEASC